MEHNAKIKKKQQKRVSRHVKHHQKKSFSKALTTRETFRWAPRALVPMDSKSPNDILATKTATIRPCATYDDDHYTLTCAHDDRCQNHSYRIASNLLVKFLQTAQKRSCYGRCKSNERDDK